MFGDFHEVKVCLLSVSLIISLRVWLNHLRKIQLVHKVKHLNDADVHQHLRIFRTKDKKIDILFMFFILMRLIFSILWIAYNESDFKNANSKKQVQVILEVSEYFLIGLCDFIVICQINKALHVNFHDFYVKNKKLICFAQTLLIMSIWLRCLRYTLLIVFDEAYKNFTEW